MDINLDKAYFDLFGDTPDYFNLCQNYSGEDVDARIKRAIEEKKPIDYMAEYGYDPVKDAEADTLY